MPEAPPQKLEGERKEEILREAREEELPEILRNWEELERVEAEAERAAAEGAREIDQAAEQGVSEVRAAEGSTPGDVAAAEAAGEKLKQEAREEQLRFAEERIRDLQGHLETLKRPDVSRRMVPSAWTKERQVIAGLLRDWEAGARDLRGELGIAPAERGEELRAPEATSATVEIPKVGAEPAAEPMFVQAETPAEMKEKPAEVGGEMKGEKPAEAADEAPKSSPKNFASGQVASGQAPPVVEEEPLAPRRSFSGLPPKVEVKEKEDAMDILREAQGEGGAGSAERAPAPEAARKREWLRKLEGVEPKLSEKPDDQVALKRIRSAEIRRLRREVGLPAGASAEAGEPPEAARPPEARRAEAERRPLAERAKRFFGKAFETVADRSSSLVKKLGFLRGGMFERLAGARLHRIEEGQQRNRKEFVATERRLAEIRARKAALPGELPPAVARMAAAEEAKLEANRERLSGERDVLVAQRERIARGREAVAEGRDAVSERAEGKLREQLEIARSREARIAEMERQVVEKLRPVQEFAQAAWRKVSEVEKVLGVGAFAKKRKERPSFLPFEKRFYEEKLKEYREAAMGASKSIGNVERIVERFKSQRAELRERVRGLEAQWQKLAPKPRREGPGNPAGTRVERVPEAAAA